MFCLRYTKSQPGANTPVQTAHPWNFLIHQSPCSVFCDRLLLSSRKRFAFSLSLSLSDACFSCLEGHKFFIYLQVLIIEEPTKAIIASSKKKCFCSLPGSVIKANLERVYPAQRSQQPAWLASLERKVCRRPRKQVCVWFFSPLEWEEKEKGKKKRRDSVFRWRRLWCKGVCWCHRQKAASNTSPQGHKYHAAAGAQE